jgi:RNA recognition motif-containing protein
MSIHVSNLDCNTTRNNCAPPLQSHLAVNAVSIVADRCNGRYRNVGLVEMTYDQECQNAVQHLNGRMLAGCRIAAIDSQSKTIHSRGVNVEIRWWKRLV